MPSPDFLRPPDASKVASSQQPRPPLHVPGAQLSIQQLPEIPGYKVYMKERKDLEKTKADRDGPDSCRRKYQVRSEASPAQAGKWIGQDDGGKYFIPSDARGVQAGGHSGCIMYVRDAAGPRRGNSVRFENLDLDIKQTKRGLTGQNIETQEISRRKSDRNSGTYQRFSKWKNSNIDVSPEKRCDGL